RWRERHELSGEGGPCTREVHTAQHERNMIEPAVSPFRAIGKLASSLVFGITLACSCSAWAEKVRVAIPGLSPNSAFFMVAIEKGYFAAENIDVDVVQA